MLGKTRPAAAADRKFEHRSDVRVAHVQHACRPHAAGPLAPNKLATFSPRAEVLGHTAKTLLAIPRQRTAASGFAERRDTLVDTYFRPPPEYTPTPDRRSR